MLQFQNLSYHLISVTFIAIYLTGCVTVEETIFLQQAEVTGSVNPPPVHLTDSSDTPSFTISPKFNYNTANTFTGNIEERTGSYILDTILVIPENSLVWDVTTINAGVDFDLALSRSFAISFGALYSTHSNFTTWGGNFGIGFFGYSSGSAFRFDAGIQVNTMKYDAYTVVHRVETSPFGGGTEEYDTYYHDVGKDTHIDPYFSLTYNTAFKHWPINLFVNAGYSVQTLFSFEPRTVIYHLGSYIRTDLRGSSTAGFITVTPGVYFFVGEKYRALFGTRFFIESLIGEADPKLMIIPMVQFDFRL